MPSAPTGIVPARASINQRAGRVVILTPDPAPARERGDCRRCYLLGQFRHGPVIWTGMRASLLSRFTSLVA